MADVDKEVKQFRELADPVRAELLRIADVLASKRWQKNVRYFAPGSRGGHILQFLDCTYHEKCYRHDLECYEPIECFLGAEDPETGELYPFYPVDPILTRRQLKALLRVTNNTFNDIAPDIEGRLACWCVCAATSAFVRQLFADPENPWPTKVDRRWMREERKNGGRGTRRHTCGFSCDVHRRPKKD